MHLILVISLCLKRDARKSIKRSSLNFHFTIYSQYFTNNPHKCEISGIKRMRGGSWNSVHPKMWHSTIWRICSVYFQQSHEFIIKALLMNIHLTLFIRAFSPTHLPNLIFKCSKIICDPSPSLKYLMQLQFFNAACFTSLQAFFRLRCGKVLVAFLLLQYATICVIYPSEEFHQRCSGYDCEWCIALECYLMISFLIFMIRHSNSDA